jgi:hypothetical protein
MRGVEQNHPSRQKEASMARRLWHPVIFFASIFLFLLISVPAQAAMQVDTFGIEMSQNFNGEDTTYGYSLQGYIDESFDYILLLGPDPDGTDGDPPPVLADSRTDELVAPTSGNGYRFQLYGASSMQLPSTGSYTAEIYTADSTLAYSKTIPIESDHIPTGTPVITYPTPLTYYNSTPLGFTWEPYPLLENETVNYSFEIMDVVSSTIERYSTGTGTMGVCNDALATGAYVLFVFADVPYAPIPPDGVLIIKSGHRDVLFLVTSSSDLDEDGDVDGRDLENFAADYGTVIE